MLDNKEIAKNALLKFSELEGDLLDHIKFGSGEGFPNEDLLVDCLAEMFDKDLDNEDFAEENPDVHFELKQAYIYGSNPDALFFIDNMGVNGEHQPDDDGGYVELPEFTMIIVDKTVAQPVSKIQGMLRDDEIVSAGNISVQGVRVEYLQDNGMDYDAEKMMIRPSISIDKGTIQVMDEMMNIEQRIMGSELEYDACLIMENQLEAMGLASDDHDTSLEMG